MESKSAVKVGIVVLLAFGLFGGLYYYLAHVNRNAYLITVQFSNTQGLVRQSLVRMLGVTVGEVKDIRLENLRPVVTLAIDKSITIPKDSEFRIVSGILITNPIVEIRPGTSGELAKDDTATAKGAEGGSPLASLSPELSVTVSNLDKSLLRLTKRFDKAADKIDSLLDATTTLVKHTDKTVTSLSEIATDASMKQALKDTLVNFKLVSEDARVTSKMLSRELQATIQGSRGKLDDLTTKLGNILARIDNTLDDASTVVKKLTDQVTDPRLQQSLQETTELAKTTLARFNQIASDLHQLTGDPQLQNDFKQIIYNLKSATEKGDQALGKVNTLLGDVGGIGKAGRRLRLPKVELVGNVSEQFDPTRLRVDVEARVPTSDKSLVNLGLYDLGQNTRLTLQGGSRPSDSLLFRYGLYASRIGAGVEWEPRRGTGLRADLYDTNRLRLDLRALFRVNRDASVWLGTEGLFQNPVPVLGVQFRQ